MWGASDESDIVPMHCLHCFSSSPPQPCAVYHLIIIFCSKYFCFLSNEKVFQYIAIIVLPFPSPLMLLGPQKWLINETKCLELGWESRDGPMRKMFSNPLSFPHTGTSLHLKYEMALMIKSCLSVPPTLVPETAVSNDYRKSEWTATPWGEAKRKQRWVRVSYGSPKSSGLPWTPQTLLQGPGHCFCGIFPPAALPAGPAAWLCLNCHPAKGLVARPNCNPANTPGL